jgi:hypothetical protein
MRPGEKRVKFDRLSEVVKRGFAVVLRGCGGYALAVKSVPKRFVVVALGSEAAWIHSGRMCCCWRPSKLQFAGGTLSFLTYHSTCDSELHKDGRAA